MSTVEQLPDELLEAEIPRNQPDLTVIDGAVGYDTSNTLAETINGISVDVIESYTSPDGREHRIELLTLPSDTTQDKRTYACKVTEADSKLVPNPDEAELALLVDGYTEIPTAKDTTAYNRSELHAVEWPEMRTLNVDRLSHSGYAPPKSMQQAIRHASQSIEEAAADLLKIALHYNPNNKPTRLLGTSAGFTKIIEMIIQQHNENDPESKLNIAEEVFGIVPCLVTKEVPEEYNNFRTKEPEWLTLFKTVFKFGGHCTIDILDSTFHNPQGIWDTRGIFVVWAKNPLLAVMLPIQFAGHTEGTLFVDTVNAGTRHRFITASGGKDALNSEGQITAINQAVNDAVEGRENSFDNRVNPAYGHIGYVLVRGAALRELSLVGEDAVQPVENIVELGLRLVTSAAGDVGEIAVKQAAKLTLGLGRRVGLFKQSEESVPIEHSVALAA